MRTILETARLILREFEQTDFKDLAEIIQDPEVMYAYETGFTDDDVQIWLERQRTRYSAHGVGLWAVVAKNTLEIVGQAGLTMQSCEGKEVLEIGYLLKKKHWGNGYAREAAEGCKQYAFTHLRARKVHCIIKPDNTRSIHVARSIGMDLEKEFAARYFEKDLTLCLFSIESTDIG